MRLPANNTRCTYGQQLAVAMILLGWSGLPLPAQVRPERLPSPKPGLVQADWCAHLSQDDLVCLSPPAEGWEGILVGEGEAGTILWNPPDRLMFQVNHSALWDDVPAGAEAK